MAEVQSGLADFKAILVYDVSRWGRFQDADEGAYHEHVCSRAGIRVHYCGEQFENDGSIGSNLLKTVKRVMAGEYSRELSVKVFAGQCRLVELGYRQGGAAGYGLRRVLIDEHGNPKGELSRGEQKSLQTDRVILVPGPEEEQRVVERMYEMFVDEGRPEREIAEVLNGEGHRTDLDRPWTRATVHQVLTNEKYIGNNVFNKVSFTLKQRRVVNPRDMWIRAEGAYPAIVDKALFLRAREIVDARSRHFSDEELLDALRGILKRQGTLTEFASRDLTDSTEIGPTWLGRLIIGLQQLLAETEPAVVVGQIQEDLPDFLEIRPLLIDMLSFIERKAPEQEVRDAAEVLGGRLKNLRAFSQYRAQGGIRDMTIRRFSSRTHRLDQTILLEHLKGARSYKRIAGYFTSSLFEVAGELLDQIPEVKIVCNVDIHPDDLKVAKLREAKMIGRWNERALEAEALLNRERYRRLDTFLQKHGQAVRVAPDNVCGFLHGKAGVIECADGRKLGFIGSMNETSSGWQRHYEILWEDSSPEGVAWIEEEFDFLWRAAKELPRAVIREVHRRGYRREVFFDELDDPEDIAPAALIESPLYREGFSLQPWQQGFLTECLRHYSNHGIVRLLLADEVGLGKTLSLGTAALALCLLQDKDSGGQKPVVIFAPATLCEQWQTEMIDKLGIPCARWETQKKVWLDHDDRVISPAGREQIGRCPLRIGVVSTGLMMRDSLEKQHLLGLRFALVILDEAHKARSRQGFGRDAGTPNELLAFASAVAERSDHVLLGTATPIQTRSEDLWDLMRILHRGKGRFVLGNEYSRWH
ncbi:RNA polymerase-associated protein RapA [Jannaschia rubra]|uniref:RNA polymerase-associated protein RapA n=3 Tax=Jannaschia rubra TaxID=282197 RepID=A0A0M6XVW0_9RHOB|nr:RNA polymerase-associated protein RapA [Jannaschia rubra]SFG61744.1 PLD-like domain-containing protein [Jannaschia rubra]